MHLLTDEQAEQRLNHTDNLCIKTLRRDGKLAGGRKEGDKNLPPFLREVIGGLAKAGNGAKVAEEFGISQARASQLASGRMGAQPGPVDEELKEKVDDIALSMREQAVRLATLKLMAAMKSINTENLEKIESPIVASTVARNLSSIVKNLEDKDRAVEQNTVVFIHAPARKEMTEYPTITIEAKESQ
jgi:hypothetical protein